MITIEIDGVDRTDVIEFTSVVKKDAINQQVDTLEFRILYYPPEQTYRPEANEEVEMFDGATKVFGGRIIGVNGTVEGPGAVEYKIRCKDYSYDLERILVNEVYENMTVDDIVESLLDDWSDGTFTDTNVDCDLVITKVVFDRVTVVEALQRLSDMTGFSWYVDYDKDIHFFATNTEAAPYNITDDDGNYIPDTLEIVQDFSQIRNRVFVKGGEVEGEVRTELFNGDGVKKFFKLSNKFANLPALEVGGSPVNLGLDFLNAEDDYDAFWDYNQQYIRFKDSTIPTSGTNNIEVTGIPLYNLVVQVDDAPSILEHGLFEFARIDKNIKSRNEAVSLAKAEVLAYKDGVAEASFDTYVPGLRSGQIISITSSLFGIDEDYLIQSTQFRMVSRTTGVWRVQLATLRTVGIIDFLLSLLRQPGRVIEDKGEVILEKTVFPVETIGISEVIDINTNDYPQTETMELDDDVYVQALDFPLEWVVGPYIPDPSDSLDYKRVFITNRSEVV